MFPAGRDTLLTLTTRTVSTRRSMRINGVPDMGLTMTWPTSITDCILDSHRLRMPPAPASTSSTPATVGCARSAEAGRAGPISATRFAFPRGRISTRCWRGSTLNFPRMAGWLLVGAGNL